MSTAIDASVTLAWCFEDEASNATDQVFADSLQSGAVVPELWTYEVGNVLALAQGRERISEAGARAFLGILERIPLDRVAPPPIEELMGLARTHLLTPYDAAYLHAAMARGTPLATLDARLIVAAESAGVELALEN